MKNQSYTLSKENLDKVSEPVGLYIIKSFINSSVLDNLSKNSIELFSTLIANSGLTIKILAENIFEITPKTLIKYKSTTTKIPSRIAELAIELNTLYEFAVEIFGSTSVFNNWLNKENVFFNNKQPASFLNTSTGIHIIFEELKRIEFGATA